VNSVLWNRITVLLAALGLFVAASLALKEAFQLELICGPTNGCESVTSHASAYWLGLPVAYYGLAGYLFFAVLGFLRAAATGPQWKKLTVFGLIASGIGFVVSIYLTYTALVVIRATCYWCLASALILTLLFAVHTFMFASEPPREKDPKANFLTFASATTAILAAFVIGFTSRPYQEGVKDIPAAGLAKIDMTKFETDASKTKGNEDAKVTLLEFLDVNCPPCRAQYPKIKAIYDEYGGRLRLAYRHQPNNQIQGHETSLQAAAILEAAAQEGKVWEVLDAFMDPANVNAVRSLNGLRTIAIAAGMKEEVVDQAISSPSDEITSAVAGDIIFSQEIKSQGTPTFVLVAEGQPPRFVTTAGLRDALRAEPYASLLSK